MGVDSSDTPDIYECDVNLSKCILFHHIECHWKIPCEFPISLSHTMYDGRYSGVFVSDMYFVPQLGMGACSIRICPSYPSCRCCRYGIPLTAKNIGCFNHRVVTLVAVKLRRQWL